LPRGLFDHLVGAKQDRWRYRKAERLGGLEVHGQLELGRKLHREIARFFATQDAIDFIPIRAAHTGGDTNIKFEKANVLFIGDFYRNYGYPFIDINNGGTLKGMLEGLETTMKSADANTTIVPGHGTLIRRDAIVPYRDMILAVAGKVEQMVAQGKSLHEVLAAKLTAPYDAKVAGGTESSAERFVSAVYQELKGGGK
jgi:glyoxylase-like metal-dependent hydrolase (beta-lactamase superfamily II)